MGLSKWVYLPADLIKWLINNIFQNYSKEYNGTLSGKQFSHSETLSGKQFNEQFTKQPDNIDPFDKFVKYCKIFSNDANYVEGLNENNNKIYFWNINDFHTYLNHDTNPYVWNGNKFSFVLIPDDAKVSVTKMYENEDYYEYYSDKIILTKIINLEDLNLSDFLTQDQLMCVLNQDGYLLKYVKNQTSEMGMIAIQESTIALQWVEKQTEEMCKLAIQKDGLSLCNVITQTPELCKLAVCQNGNSLKCVKEQTYELCKLAVCQNGCALQYVNNQTIELCELAIQQNDFASRFINKKIY